MVQFRVSVIISPLSSNFTLPELVVLRVWYIANRKGLPLRMWDTFYGNSAYIQITFITCQELAYTL